jgi:hypothetical protein
MIDTFTMPDGRNVKVDFTSTTSCLSIPKSDWVEIKKQLEKYLRIVCSQLSGEEVYDLFKGKLTKKSYRDFILK